LQIEKSVHEKSAQNAWFMGAAKGQKTVLIIPFSVQEDLEGFRKLRLWVDS